LPRMQVVRSPSKQNPQARQVYTPYTPMSGEARCSGGIRATRTEPVEHLSFRGQWRLKSSGHEARDLKQAETSRPKRSCNCRTSKSQNPQSSTALLAPTLNAGTGMRSTSSSIGIARRTASNARSRSPLMRSRSGLRRHELADLTVDHPQQREVIRNR
jgi:hypothetical protein